MQSDIIPFVSSLAQMEALHAAGLARPVPGPVFFDRRYRYGARRLAARGRARAVESGESVDKGRANCRDFHAFFVRRRIARRLRRRNERANRTLRPLRPRIADRRRRHVCADGRRARQRRIVAQCEQFTGNAAREFARRFIAERRERFARRTYAARPAFVRHRAVSRRIR